MDTYIRRGKVAERPHLNLPDGTYEEELGLEGFFGPVSHLYHRAAPTSWTKIERSSFQWPDKKEVPPAFLKPECYKSAGESLKGDFFESSRLLFWNDDVAIHIHGVTKSSPVYFRNADASEVIFCHEGKGTLQSPFGSLDFGKGDYVTIPKGVTYRISGSSLYLLRIENFSTRFKKPETGILGQQALYHQEGIRAPELKPAGDKSSVVRTQMRGLITEISYSHDITDIAGWCGTLYPYALSVDAIAPVVSPIAHLPPSVNATFVSDAFIVCTFLPRPLEEPAGALKVPFYHSNIDYDEVIFYHAGDFFSRDNMGPAYLTLHPRGVNHGPHPKALKNQNSKTRTNEIAVMVDTVKPLKVSSFGRELEIKEYWKSWGAS